MKIEQLAINSISTKGTLEEKLAAYRAAGFKNVEFALGDVKEFLASGHSISDAQNLLRENNLKCIGGFEGTLLAFAEDDERAQNQAQLLENAKLLQSLGGSTLVVGTDGPSDASTPAEEVLAQLASAFAEVGREIADTNVCLAIEFNWSPVVKSLRTAAEISRRANAQSGLDNVGILFDPAHYHCTPTKFEQLTPETIALIKHVHVDDMKDKPGELSDCNSDRALPGQGCLDLPALFGKIESGGYSGLFSIEMFDPALWALSSREAAQKMHDSLLTLCD